MGCLPQSALVGHSVHPCRHHPQGAALPLTPVRVKKCFSCSCTHFLLQHLYWDTGRHSILESVRVTTEESYFGTYFGSSHALQEMEPPHVRSGHLYNKNLARRSRSFLPAKMDPAKPFSGKNRFLNIFGITRDSAVCVCFHADRSQVLSCAASWATLVKHRADLQLCWGLYTHSVWIAPVS